MTGKQLTLWEVFEKYADVREDLEYVLYQCAEIEDFLKLARQEIHEELERIQNDLNNCDRVFRRYKVAPECDSSTEEVDEGMPF